MNCTVEEIYFKRKSIIRAREDHSIMTKGFVLQEDIILNMRASN